MIPVLENALQVMSDPMARLYLPATALAEAVWIAEQGRMAAMPVESLLRDTKQDPRIEVPALSEAIVLRTVALGGIREMHDRQIVATALELAAVTGAPVPLLTRDENITASGLVAVVW